MTQFDRVPSWPDDVPSSQRGEGTFVSRYDDVVQDGRLRLQPMSYAIGAAIWQPTLGPSADYRRLSKAGIVPILSRMLIQVGGGPIAAITRLTASGAYVVRRTTDEAGEQRLRVDMWAGVRGPRGRTWGEPPAGAGEAIELGAIYCEHVLTRLFAPPEERKVTALPEGTTIALREGTWSPPKGVVALPDGASWLGDEVAEPHVTVFGLGHTDSNQHVNSLVYPHLAEEAALRFFAEHGFVADHGVSAGHDTARFADFVDLGFRKPFFAGERTTITLRPYQRARPDGRVALGIAARFAPPGASDPGRAHAYARLELVP